MLCITETEYIFLTTSHYYSKRDYSLNKSNTLLFLLILSDENYTVYSINTIVDYSMRYILIGGFSFSNYCVTRILQILIKTYAWCLLEDTISLFC